MKVTYHPHVQQDIRRILKKYDEASPRVGDEFWDELMAFVKSAGANPERFHFDQKSGLRRVNLQKFPYHFLYRTIGDKIRVIVVRHNKRNPTLGSRRR